MQMLQLWGVFESYRVQVSPRTAAEEVPSLQVRRASDRSLSGARSEAQEARAASGGGWRKRGAQKVRRRGRGRLIGQRHQFQPLVGGAQVRLTDHRRDHG